MRLSRVLTPCAVLLISACSSASWYQSARTSGEIECRRQPEGRYQECMREYEKTYQQYKQQREEAIAQ